MDDQIKAKVLMAGGLLILAAIGLVIVLVVLPGVQAGTGSHTAVAQEGGEPGGSMPMGPEMMEPGGGGMPGGMPGMMPGMMPGGAPLGGGGGGGAAQPAAPERVVEPLEASRDNPFGPFAGAGLVSERVPAGLAFSPSYHTMPIGILEQHQFLGVGPNGQTIKVPKGVPSRKPGGPEAPPKEEWLRVAGVMYGKDGKAMVILQGGRGGDGAVLSVGDRYHGWRVEAITRNQMVLSKEEDGTKRRRIIHLQTGGGGRRPARPTGARGGATTPAGPGVALPGARGGQQPGIRRPGTAQPGAFPGVGGGQPQRRPGARPAPE